MSLLPSSPDISPDSSPRVVDLESERAGELMAALSSQTARELLSELHEEPAPPSELADRLDYDESTVRTYLNELVDFGLLEKSQLNRESGGYVNVYHSIDLDEMREETLVGFYAWAGEAASLIDEANLTKEDYRDAEFEGGLNEVFWERFRDARSTD
jgi:predicted transcriptional regulator